MANNSIGSLFVDIAARTATLEKDLGKVKSMLGGVGEDVKTLGRTFGASTSKIEGSVLRFGLLILGARSIVTLLAHDLKDVAKNVEDIKGLPPEVVSGVQELRHNLEGSNGAFKVGIAYLESYVQKTMRFLGAVAGAASLKVQGVSDTDVGAAFREGLKPMVLTPNDLSKDRMGEANFDKSLKAAQEELNKEQLKYYSTGVDASHKLLELNIDRLEVQEKIYKSGLDDIEIAKLRTQAQRIQNEMKQVEYEQNKKISELSDMDASVIAQRSDLFVTKQKKLNDLLVERAALQKEDVQLSASVGDIQAAVGDRLINVKQKELILDERINVAMKAAGDMWKLMGEAMSRTLEDAIFQGGKLSDVLKSLVVDMLKIYYEKQIMPGVTDFFSTALSSLFGGHAMGGPIGNATMVGENGPELLLGAGSSTIIPNEQLRSGRQSGSVFNIDARSADQAGIMQLMTLIRQLNGSIELRAVAAVANANRRRS